MKRFEIGDNLSIAIMVLALLIFLSVIAITTAKAQTVVPNAILDTMIMEVKYARQCGIALEATQAENKALGEELLHTGTALELSQRSNETLSALLNNARDYSGILTHQFTLDKNKLKAKIKRLWIWVTTEGVVIVVLIILL